VNVAGARASPRREHQVHQLDDRSFVGGFLQIGQADFLFFGLQFDIGIIDPSSTALRFPGLLPLVVP
jgi:hypothetical protein